MTQITIDTYKEAEDALRRSDLRQALYDEGAVLMKKVLVNLHGDEHLARKRVVTKILRPAFFHYYEKNVFRPTLTQTLAPYVAAGKADLVEFGYRVMLNLTADFAGIDRPARSTRETDTLLIAAAHLRQGRDARPGPRRSRRDSRRNPARARRVRRANSSRRRCGGARSSSPLTPAAKSPRPSCRAICCS